MGKRSDEEEEDDEEEDLEPKIVSVPAFPSKYFIAKEVDRVLRGKGTKKCVLLMYEKTYDCLNSVESSPMSSWRSVVFTDRYIVSMFPESLSEYVQGRSGL
ncbi:hypothetical protein QR680_010895 [Steinernema hermaphroditum]|uniref:Uncharacterized protein n=1 Tax=Steinernema hermaphroditum TaxID=289476 RepID=A0AA39MBX7_9BILA|nr:hypothetical protein QR680_010895 [Steinernema hermaphroditum]